MVRRASTESGRADRAPRRSDQPGPGRPARPPRSLTSAVEEARPAEVYNLAAQSFVPTSWNQPVLTASSPGSGHAHARGDSPSRSAVSAFTRHRQSEMFGKVREVPQNELTPFYPRSPYGVAKVVRTLHHGQLPRVIRALRPPESCSTTSRRAAGCEFVTRKITDSVARIKLGLARGAWARQSRRRARLGLRGRLRACDVAHAAAGEPGDYVVATGKTHSVREFVERVRACGTRLGAACRDRPAIHASGRGRSADRRRVQGP